MNRSGCGRLLLLSCLLLGRPVLAEQPARFAQGAPMTHHAAGTFTVKITPADAAPFEEQAGFTRMDGDKVFSGALSGTSQLEMLTSSTASTGAMVYVALEKVTGSLDGHRGTLLLMHQGSMRKGEAASAVLSVRVVPGSGTEALAGISGEMTITVSGGAHSYELTYSMPE